VVILEYFVSSVITIIFSSREHQKRYDKEFGVLDVVKSKFIEGKLQNFAVARIAQKNGLFDTLYLTIEANYRFFKTLIIKTKYKRYIWLVERLYKDSLSRQKFIQYLTKFSRRILRRPLKLLFQIISTSLQ